MAAEGAVIGRLRAKISMSRLYGNTTGCLLSLFSPFPLFSTPGGSGGGVKRCEKPIMTTRVRSGVGVGVGDHDRQVWGGDGGGGL